MTVIIFLLDNTPSMLQQTMMNGVRNSYIDIAKQTVEMFLELRHSHEDRKNDRYMLLTYDVPPNHVKVGWNESMNQFENALKTLECTGSTLESKALNNVFELLNQERMMVSLDTYGYGRCPFYNMFSFIVLLTNYHHFPKVTDTPFLSLGPNAPGSQLTKEPFRWDQRLFALFLGSSKSSSYIEKMALAMGGWCMPIRSKESWNQSLSRLEKSFNFELIVKFVLETDQFTRVAETDIIKLEPSNFTISCCDKKWKGSWPFPESYWPDLQENELPPRDAFPVMRILPDACCNEPVWKMNFPVDKYELRERMYWGGILPTMERGKVLPVVIMLPTRRQELPFGYLKRDKGKIFFYISVYNYPELHRLVEEYYPNLSAKNSNFVYALRHFIYTIPSYYWFYLRKALSGILESEVLEMVLPNECVYYLNNRILVSLYQMRQAAKQHRMQLCDYVSKQQDIPKVKKQETAPLINEHPLLKRKKENSECTVKTIVVPTIERSTSSSDYRKLYPIDRKDLLDMINRMRNAFYYPENVSCCMNSLKHAVPISEMQSYASKCTQQSVTKLRTLRDSDSTEKILLSPTVRYNPRHPRKHTSRRMKLL